MSRIRGKNTAPEIIVRKFLHRKGYRYRLHDKKLPGKPDIVLRKLNTIIEVRGCFWHVHEACKFGEQISTHSSEVSSKRESAVLRDKIKTQKWKQMGWKVIVIWAECELEPKRRHSNKREKRLNDLLKELKR